MSLLLVLFEMSGRDFGIGHYKTGKCKSANFQAGKVQPDNKKLYELDSPEIISVSKTCRDIWPFVFIKSGHIVETVFVHTENKVFFFRIEL